MKGYCTVRDVRNALSPTGEPEGSASTLTDAQIADAITEAEGMVDTFLSARYTIAPVNEEDASDPDNVLIYLVAPAPVRDWTRNIAAWLATLTYRKSKDIGEDDPIRLRYNMTIGLLTDVRDGKSGIDLPTVDTGSQGAEIFNLYEGKLFGMEDVGLGYDRGSVQRIERARYWEE